MYDFLDVHCTCSLNILVGTNRSLQAYSNIGNILLWFLDVFAMIKKATSNVLYNFQTTVLRIKSTGWAKKN